MFQSQRPTTTPTPTTTIADKNTTLPHVPPIPEEHPCLAYAMLRLVPNASVMENRSSHLSLLSKTHLYACLDLFSSGGTSSKHVMSHRSEHNTLVK
jgi:hypothetical protein